MKTHVKQLFLGAAIVLGIIVVANLAGAQEPYFNLRWSCPTAEGSKAIGTVTDVADNTNIDNPLRLTVMSYGCMLWQQLHVKPVKFIERVDRQYKSTYWIWEFVDVEGEHHFANMGKNVHDQALRMLEQDRGI